MGQHQQHDRLHQLAAGDDFAAITAAVEVYGQALRQELENLPRAQALSVLENALTNLESSRRKVMASRAGLLHELRSLPSPGVYLQHSASESIHSWKIDA